MLGRFRRLWNQFFNKSRTINNEPLNQVSLIVIIIIDIFILVNVFAGLDDISRWHLSPAQAYPCYAEWENYHTQKTNDKDYNIVKAFLSSDINDLSNFQQAYQKPQSPQLGTFASSCLQYKQTQDKIKNSENRQLIKGINQEQNQVGILEDSNRNIRSQYDSTLLEKIAGQTREQSINTVGASKAKQTLEQNNLKITAIKEKIASLKSKLMAQPEVIDFMKLIDNRDKFQEVKKGYQQASFWYPSIQFALQSLFLAPLILATLLIYRFAQRKGYGLLSLMSWHLLVIFFIPLIFKVFEFLQFGVVFRFIFDAIGAILGSLLFLVSYVYILLIPLVGFGIIKLFQKFILNVPAQAAHRVQQSRCVRCARKIRQNDAHCPHCGYYQYTECQNCHQLTYKYLPHCKQCGSTLEETP